MLRKASNLYCSFQLHILYPVIDATAWTDKHQHLRRRRKRALKARRKAQEGEKKRIAAMTAKGLLPRKDEAFLKEIET
ncbi:hypothetical protein LTR84_002289 [Exophiala bonariae]|uniref:Uncharacterized protein n=1 Tax=Exophiala bonariae TaxID=1690606 RepID=A0AAV9NFH3_9EURO|nr:hypothetical protein LTR84_002289 [Exophiala bonariae]